jgi:hypothetical protein
METIRDVDLEMSDLKFAYLISNWSEMKALSEVISLYAINWTLVREKLASQWNLNVSRAR